VFAEGSDAERACLLEQQGRDLAMFLDGLIAELSIPKSDGIALVGWSLGALFVLALIACIETLPTATQERLSSFVKNVVMLRSSPTLFIRLHPNLHIECPSLAFGVPSPPGRLIPYTDPDVAPEDRGPAFAKWVSSYFIHGDLSTHDIDHLTYNNTDPGKPPTIETLKQEELFAMTDFAPAERYDNIVALPPFADAVSKQTNKALFDSTIREAWSGARFWSLYGSAEPWIVIHGSWFLEDQSRAMDPKFEIICKGIEGSNHFVCLLALRAIFRLIKFFAACLGGSRQGHQRAEEMFVDVVPVLEFRLVQFSSSSFYMLYRSKFNSFVAGNDGIKGG
jgi:pimeloyl-ACP methyl ester carboxylesterase